MSEYADQLAVLLTTVSGVTDVGRVYNRPRFGVANDLWITEIAGIPVIRAWEIGVDETVTGRLEQGHRTRFRPWRIQGYVGPIDVDDAAATATTYPPAGATITPGYIAAVDLATSIADAIEANRTLSGTCLDIAGPDSLIGTRIEAPVVLSLPAGPLCWGIGIEFHTWTIIT